MTELQAALLESQLYEVFFRYAEALAYFQKGALPDNPEYTLKKLSMSFVVDVKLAIQSVEGK